LAEWQRIVGERKEGNVDAKGLKARKNVDARSGQRNHIFQECKHYQMAGGERPMNIKEVLVHQLHINSLLHKTLTSCY